MPIRPVESPRLDCYIGDHGLLEDERYDLCGFLSATLSAATKHIKLDLSAAYQPLGLHDPRRR